MNTNVEAVEVPEVKPFNYELWIPPFNLEVVKQLMKDDLHRALADFIGKDAQDKEEVERIVHTAGGVMAKWEERFDLLVDMSVTSPEEVTELGFGETELGFELDFPVEFEEE